MVGPGWSQPGETDPDGGSISNFIDAGYNVLTWDPRGFGGSGGTVQIDSPDFEGRDAQALIDYIAEQPEAQLDDPGDPRLGMSGGSYGGGIQIVLAGLDKRVDVIAPTIAWNSLITSLFKADKIKLGWGLALSGLGVPFGVAPGIVSPAGPQLGQQSPEFYSTVTEGVATGTVSDANRKWFADHGPDFLLDRIKVPTLIIQGTVDTLFTLEEAHRNFEALRKQGVPLKMMFFCGGHGVCLTDSDSDSAVIGGSALAEERRIQWFDRYLRDRHNVDTGPEFEWIDEQATWHTSAQYPPKQTSELTGTGSGTLPLTPGVSPPPGSGLALYGTPQDVSVKAAIPSAAGLDIVGEPKLELTYSGTAAPAQTHVFGQLVDPSRDIVVNNQVTPIPVTLDGAEHSLEIPLERIASLSTASGYELQLVAASTVYDIQRSAGLIDVKSAKLTLPVTEPQSQPVRRLPQLSVRERQGRPPGGLGRPRLPERPKRARPDRGRRRRRRTARRPGARQHRRRRRKRRDPRREGLTRPRRLRPGRRHRLRESQEGPLVALRDRQAALARRGSSMSSTRTPQMTPVISEAFAVEARFGEEVLERGARFDVVAQCGLVETGQPLDHLVQLLLRTALLLHLRHVVGIDRGEADGEDPAHARTIAAAPTSPDVW